MLTTVNEVLISLNVDLKKQEEAIEKIGQQLSNKYLELINKGYGADDMQRKYGG